MAGKPRRPSGKKGPQVGTGGHGRKKLQGKGATPPAEMRPGHPAQRRANAAQKRKPPKQRDTPDYLVGRNPVVEAMRAGVPATALYLALGLDIDERITEVVRRAGDRHLAIMEVSRIELDRLTGGLLHQGVALQVPPFEYAHPDDLARSSLLVALDGVTDPRNLGAIVRSAAAFGAQGVRFVHGGIERIQGRAQGRLIVSAPVRTADEADALAESARRYASRVEVLGYV